MARLKTLWLDMLDSLWFVPTLFTLAGAAAALLLVRFDEALLRGTGLGVRSWAFGGTAEGAAGVLGAIGGSIITVTGVVFSVTIVALQLASSQFTPRVLRQFTADRSNQVVLGVFIGTFTYTLLVQRTLRTGNGDEFVPNVAVTGAVVLALVSIAFLIFFINHAARSIQAAVIIDSVTADTLASLRQVFPERLEQADERPVDRAAAVLHDLEREDSDPPHTVFSRQTGYIQEVDAAMLLRVAERHGLFMRVEAEIGRFLLPGDEVVSVWPSGSATAAVEKQVRDAIVLGRERTPHQDLKLGVIELMDIAVKAMSPSVNDPTTALNAIDRLGEILHDMAWRRRGDRLETGPDGRPLLVIRRPELGATVGIAFDQVRHYAASNPTVAIAMTRLLGRLAAMTPESARHVFIEHLHEVRITAELTIDNPVDRKRYDAAVAEALRTGTGTAAPSGGADM